VKPRRSCVTTGRLRHLPHNAKRRAASRVFKQKLQYARDVRDGIVIDPGFQPIIYEHPPEMVKSGEHLLLENMWMVNPTSATRWTRSFWSGSTASRECWAGVAAGIPRQARQL